ncbi:carboxylesterase/lipase family protein [uncultured Parasphingopyxis sp.]|uniref:carboxylesterase/lipase family protein n=1 Tax=uncultured Parasphingopyxis sp. TaxID=1547918 RepID=UPI00261103D5|nr:carboxylesterase/lipase family protein [uncultured Parasphingopyxis sp.]
MKIWKAFAGIAIGASLAASASAQGVPAVSDIVETEYGQVQGLAADGIQRFLGLRYGAPPVGDLRFQPPADPASWDGIADATGMGAPCMQAYSPSGSRVSDFTRQMNTLFSTESEAKIDNEDCLFLNVWTPGTEGSRPVMVWFHGGGYAYGSGGWPAYDGANLARRGDVVVVTINHRLNLFGFLNLTDIFGEEFAGADNAGNADLVQSLEWVRDNIAAFGGDPNNVTIMGESGGGSKVSHMLATPSADGLFHRAIIQSGPGVISGNAEQATGLARELLAEAGIETVEQLRAAHPEHLLSAMRAVLARHGEGFGGPNFGPIVDGNYLPRNPFVPTAPEQSNDIPVMIGWNKDEMTLFTASQPWFGLIDDAALDRMAATFGENGPALIANYREENPDYSPTHIANRAMSARFVQGSYILADAQARAGAPVYMYRLTWETPVNGGIFRSPHTLDIPMMFDNVELSRVLVGPGEAPQRIADQMSEAWISFARTGTPSSDHLPDWPRYTPDSRMVMQFDLEPNVADDPERGAREILSGR